MPSRSGAVVSQDQWERSQYYRCRTLGHAWFDYDDPSWSPMFGSPLLLRCERCGTERRDIVNNNTGDLDSRKYSYPEGYAYGSDAVPTRSDFRLMLLRQRMDESRKSRKSS